MPMKTTPLLQCVAIATALVSTSVMAAEGSWMIDFEAAKKKATAENKDLYVNFTGSDW